MEYETRRQTIEEINSGNGHILNLTMKVISLLGEATHRDEPKMTAKEILEIIHAYYEEEHVKIGEIEEILNCYNASELCAKVKVDTDEPMYFMKQTLMAANYRLRNIHELIA